MIDPLEHRLGYQLRRASAVMMGDLTETLEPYGLRPTEASVLLAVSANPDAAQADIGRLLSVKRANMAPIIAALLARDLIERRALDGRSQGVTVTTIGQRMVEGVQAAIDAHETRFTTRLPARQLTALIRTLTLIRAGRSDLS